MRLAAFGAASEWLVTAGDGGDGCLWSMADPKNLRCLAMADSETLYDVRISPDRRWVAAVGLADTALLWDLTRPASHGAMTIGRGLATARYVRFGDDGSGLVVWGINNRDSYFWDLARSPLPPSPEVLHHPADVEKVVVAPRGGRLASIDEAGGASRWGGHRRSRARIGLRAPTSNPGDHR